MTEVHWYRTHGLTIRSSLDLPEFAPVAAGEADIVVRSQRPAPAPDRPSLTPEEPDGWRLDIPEVGALSARSGRELTVRPDPSAEPGLLRLYVIGSGLGMLLHQRRELVLHGAAVEISGSVTVLVGQSGAGKSTLAAHLGACGCGVLGDDTVVVRPHDSGFAAWPGAVVVKLWEDAISGLGLEASPQAQIAGRHAKFYMPNINRPPDAPLPVSRVVEIVEGEKITLEPVLGIEALGVVAEHTYRPEYVGLMGDRETHFKQAAAFSHSVEVARLTRPRDAARLPDVARLLIGRAGA